MCLFLTRAREDSPELNFSGKRNCNLETQQTERSFIHFLWRGFCSLNIKDYRDIKDGLAFQWSHQKSNISSEDAHVVANKWFPFVYTKEWSETLHNKIGIWSFFLFGFCEISSSTQKLLLLIDWRLKTGSLPKVSVTFRHIWRIWRVSKHYI